MIKSIIHELETLGERVMKIINYGFFISFIIAVVGIVFILNYNTYELEYEIYEAGELLIKAGFNFAAMCLASGFVFDKIKG